MITLLSPEQVESERRSEELRFKMRLNGYAEEETRLTKSLNNLRLTIQSGEKKKGEIERYLQDHGEWVERIEAIEDREDDLARRERAVAQAESRLAASAKSLEAKWVEYHTAVFKANGSIPVASQSK